MRVRAARRDEVDTLVALSLALWPDAPADEQRTSYEAAIDDPGAALLLACDAEGRALGFAECRLRHDYVEGTNSSPVAYLEGLYVDPAYRRRGIARALVAAARDWGRRCGCTEFASDCVDGNDASLAMHLALGFEVAGRIICFRQTL